MKSHGYALHAFTDGPVLQVLTEPLAVHQRYIREHMSKREQALRLRLLRKVPTRLVPAAIRQADEARRQADEARHQAYEAWRRAYETQCQAYEDNRPQVEALHTKLCLPDCPWDGATIFPAGQKLEA